MSAAAVAALCDAPPSCAQPCTAERAAAPGARRASLAARATRRASEPDLWSPFSVAGPARLAGQLASASKPHRLPLSQPGAGPAAKLKRGRVRRSSCAGERQCEAAGREEACRRQQGSFSLVLCKYLLSVVVVVGRDRRSSLATSLGPGGRTPPAHRLTGRTERRISRSTRRLVRGEGIFSADVVRGRIGWVRPSKRRPFGCQRAAAGQSQAVLLTFSPALLGRREVFVTRGIRESGSHGTTSG